MLGLVSDTKRHRRISAWREPVACYGSASAKSTGSLDGVGSVFPLLPEPMLLRLRMLAVRLYVQIALRRLYRRMP